MTGTQNNRLTGIVSTQDGEVTIWEMIREACYDSTGFVPAPYLYSQAQKRTHEKKTVSDYRTDTIPTPLFLL
ncbi:MAG: hypothetical protein GX111_10565 [Clostridiales bacterium]|nr:hypothetical protein [Clostridiales bacterium]